MRKALDNGAKPDAVSNLNNNNDETPLKYSICNNYFAEFELLLNAGARPDFQYSAPSPIELAVQLGNRERFVQALLRAGAKLSAKAERLIKVRSDVTKGVFLETPAGPVKLQESSDKWSKKPTIQEPTGVLWNAGPMPDLLLGQVSTSSRSLEIDWGWKRPARFFAFDFASGEYCLMSRTTPAVYWCFEVRDFRSVPPNILAATQELVRSAGRCDPVGVQAALSSGAAVNGEVEIDGAKTDALRALATSANHDSACRAATLGRLARAGVRPLNWGTVVADSVDSPAAARTLLDAKVPLESVAGGLLRSTISMDLVKLLLEYGLRPDQEFSVYTKDAVYGYRSLEQLAVTTQRLDLYDLLLPRSNTLQSSFLGESARYAVKKRQEASYDRAYERRCGFLKSKFKTMPLEEWTESSDRCSKEARIANTELAKAARGGNAIEVARLLEQGVDPDYTNDSENILRDGSTPLMLACRNGNLNVVRSLIGAGADINAVNKLHATPLIEAALNGQTPCLNELLSRGAQKGTVDVNGFTYADWARHSAVFGPLQREYNSKWDPQLKSAWDALVKAGTMMVASSQADYSQRLGSMQGTPMPTDPQQRNEELNARARALGRSGNPSMSARIDAANASRDFDGVAEAFQIRVNEMLAKTDPRLKSAIKRYLNEVILANYLLHLR
jgi:ankyrin repeat protein